MRLLNWLIELVEIKSVAGFKTRSTQISSASQRITLGKSTVVASSSSHISMMTVAQNNLNNI